MVSTFPSRLIGVLKAPITVRITDDGRYCLCMDQVFSLPLLPLAWGTGLLAGLLWGALSGCCLTHLIAEDLALEVESEPAVYC